VDAVDGNWSCSRATRYMLQAAIHEFYHEFDRKLYESFDNPNGLFTKVIWDKFRTLQKAWNVLHQAKMVADGRAQKAIESAARGHLKRQAKEKQRLERLCLGKRLREVRLLDRLLRDFRRPPNSITVESPGFLDLFFRTL